MSGLFREVALRNITGLAAQTMACPDAVIPDELAQRLYNACRVALDLGADEVDVAKALAAGVPE